MQKTIENGVSIYVTINNDIIYLLLLFYTAYFGDNVFESKLINPNYIQIQQLNTMGNKCASKQKNTIVQAPKPVVASQYNLTANAHPDELKYFTLGKQYESLGDFAKAVECFNLASQVSPYSSMPYNGLGNCYVKMGDYARAIQQYRRAIKFDPNNKFAYNGLGVAYEITNNDKEAIENFNKSINLDQNFAYPYNGLANLFYSRGNYAEAIPYYESALRLSPGNPLVIANLACSQMNSGRSQQGFQNFRNAVAAAQAQGANLSPTDKYFLTQRLTQFENALARSDGKYLQQYKQLSADGFGYHF